MSHRVDSWGSRDHPREASHLPLPHAFSLARAAVIGTSHTASWRWPTASSTFVNRCSSPSCRGSASPRAAAACSSA